MPEFGTENQSTLFQDFLFISAVLRVGGRKQNLRQTQYAPDPGCRAFRIESWGVGL